MVNSTNNIEKDKKALVSLLNDEELLNNLSRTKPEFNIFEVLGVEHREIRHSKFLRFLLDPVEHHNWKEQFLYLFLNKVFELSDVSFDINDYSNLGNATVITEWNNIDQLIVSKSNRLVVVVENKIFSGEHSDQLARYRKTIEKEYRAYSKIYLLLSPDGIKPSDDEYIPMDYGVTRHCLENVRMANIETIPPAVLSIVDQYIKLLGEYIMGDNSISQQCLDIYRKHRRAIELLIEHRPKTSALIAEHILKLRADANKSHGIISGYTGTSTYFAFSTNALGILDTDCKNAGWDNGLEVFIEFENSWDSLFLMGYIGQPGEQALRAAAFEHFNASNLIVGKRTKSSQKGPMPIYQNELLTPKDYDLDDMDTLEEKIDMGWQHFLNVDLPVIEKVASKMIIPPST